MSRPLRSAITFLLGSAIFVLLPILAWGVSDIDSFLSTPARFGYLLVALALNAFAAIRIPEVGKEKAEQKTTVQRQHLAVLLLQLFSTAVVVVGPYCDRRGIAVMSDGEALRFAGLGLYTAGFLFMHYAEAYLGKQFSVEVGVLEDHALITSGPYRYLRHPRYFGISLFMVGLSLIFRSWVGLLLAAATIPVLLWRIHDEEALMRQQFGTAWENYVRRSWRLVPFLY